MSGQDLVSDQGLRIDGRRANELRQIRVRMGVFGQSDGSAYVEQGNTKVLAAVYGPHQQRGSGGRGGNKGNGCVVNCQYSMAVFSFSAGDRKKRPRGDRKTQETSIQLRRALEAIIQMELYPRSQIDVFVEVLQSDGSDYCVAVNAATLALIDAGIPIKDYSVGCTATISSMGSSEEVESKDGVGAGTIVDVNHMEECTGATTLTAVALPGAPGSSYESDPNNSGLVVVAYGGGQRLHLSRLEGLRQRVIQGCRDTRVILDQAVRQHLGTHGTHFT